jgi:type III secretion protein S
MHPDSVLELTSNAMLLTLLLTAPIVIAAAALGLLLGLLQAVTSIQDQSIGSSVKLLVIGAMVALLGGWFGRQILAFAHRIFDQLMVGA